ncbi:9130_t:CDS:2, partial [Funneliformis geosporum]
EELTQESYWGIRNESIQANEGLLSRNVDHLSRILWRNFQEAYCLSVCNCFYDKFLNIVQGISSTPNDCIIENVEFFFKVFQSTSYEILLNPSQSQPFEYKSYFTQEVRPTMFVVKMFEKKSLSISMMEFSPDFYAPQQETAKSYDPNTIIYGHPNIIDEDLTIDDEKHDDKKSNRVTKKVIMLKW